MMNRVTIGVLLGVLPLLTVAAEMHGEHSTHAMMPSVNAVEEAGVPDGAWAPTGMEISQAQRCALAARGVVMLDNAAWAACGGKPAAVPQSVVPARTNPHAGH
jgi:hypothetical protein